MMNRLRRIHFLGLMCALMICGAIPDSLASGLNNPCVETNAYIDCTSDDRRPAEIEFKVIKLNDRRRSNVSVAMNQPLVVSTELRYTKRAKVYKVKEYDECVTEKEKKRLKVPVTNVVYTVSSDWTNFVGTGLIVTNLQAPAEEGSYNLTVRFETEGSCDCVDLTDPPSREKTFTLTVGDIPFVSNIVATLINSDGSAGDTINSGHYLMKNQQQEIEFLIELDKPKQWDITWNCEPATAGNFIGENGANGVTVRWKQAPDFVSDKADDVVISANILGADPMEFEMTVFSIQSAVEHGLEPHVTNMGEIVAATYELVEDELRPGDAEAQVVVDIMNNGPLLVGSLSNEVSLYTRETSESWDVKWGDYYPETNIQVNAAENADKMIIDEVSFVITDDDKVAMEIFPGEAMGDVDLVWETHGLNSHRMHINSYPGAYDIIADLITEGTNVETYILPCGPDQTVAFSLGDLRNVAPEDLLLTIDAQNVSDADQKTIKRLRFNTNGEAVLTVKDGSRVYDIELLAPEEDEENQWMDDVRLIVLDLNIMKETESGSGQFAFVEGVDKVCVNEAVSYLCDVTPSSVRGDFVWDTDSSRLSIDSDPAVDRVTVTAGSTSSGNESGENLWVRFIPEDYPLSQCVKAHEVHVRYAEFSATEVVTNYNDLDVSKGKDGTGLRTFNAWLMLRKPKTLPHLLDWRIYRTRGGTASMEKGVITFDKDTKEGTYLISASPCGAEMKLVVDPPPEPPGDEPGGDDEQEPGESEYQVWDEENDPNTGSERNRFAENGLLEVVAPDTVHGRLVVPNEFTHPEGPPVWRLNNEQLQPHGYEVKGEVGAGWANLVPFLFAASRKTHSLVVDDEQWTIKAYPGGEMSVSIGFDDKIESLLKGLGVLKEPLKDYIILPSGTFTFKNQWLEIPGDNEVMYTFDLDAALEPLIGIQTPGMGVGIPGISTPKVVEKLLDVAAGVYVFASLGANVVGGAHHNLSSWGVHGGASAVGAVGVRIGVKVPDIQVTVEGETGLTLEGKLTMKGGTLALPIEFKLDDLSTSVNVELWDGRLNYQRKWVPIQGFTIYPAKGESAKPIWSTRIGNSH